MALSEIISQQQLKREIKKNLKYCNFGVIEYLLTSGGLNPKDLLECEYIGNIILSNRVIDLLLDYINPKKASEILERIDISNFQKEHYDNAKKLLNIGGIIYPKNWTHFNHKVFLEFCSEKIFLLTEDEIYNFLIGSQNRKNDLWCLNKGIMDNFSICQLIIMMSKRTITENIIIRFAIIQEHLDKILSFLLLKQIIERSHQSLFTDFSKVLKSYNYNFSEEYILLFCIAILRADSHVPTELQDLKIWHIGNKLNNLTSNNICDIYNKLTEEPNCKKLVALLSCEIFCKYDLDHINDFLDNAMTYIPNIMNYIDNFEVGLE